MCMTSHTWQFKIKYFNSPTAEAKKAILKTMISVLGIHSHNSTEVNLGLEISFLLRVIKK